MATPFFSEASEAMVALESMVDKAGLRNVVFALAHICGAKAEHLHSNWQDHGAAELWENDGHKLEAFAGRLNYRLGGAD